MQPRVLSVFDLGYWSYTTVVGDVVRPFEPVISDPESRELAWVPVGDVSAYPLHPGFAASWEGLRGLLDVRPAVIVDVANVMGSVPDGWWNDRSGAASRLIARIADLAVRGVPASALELPEHTWYPEWTAVVEGQARSAAEAAGVDVVRAEASGDDAIVVAARAGCRRGARRDGRHERSRPRQEVDGCRSRRPRCALAARPVRDLILCVFVTPATRAPVAERASARRSVANPSLGRHSSTRVAPCGGVAAAVRFAQDPTGAGADTRPDATDGGAT